MQTTIVTLGDYEIVELESMILETRWNNNETIRLLENEVTSLLVGNGTSEVSSWSSTALNLRWMRTHLYRVGNNLDQMKTEILKWKQVQIASETSTAETTRIEKWYLEEKERGISLCNSLGLATISQQAHEATIQDMKTKFKLLQKDLKKAQHHNSERDARLQKLHEKYRTFTEMQQKEGTDDADLIGSDVVTKKCKLMVESKMPSTGRNVIKSIDEAPPHAVTEARKRKRPLVNLPVSNTLVTSGEVCTSAPSRKDVKCVDYTEPAHASSKLSDPCPRTGSKTTASARISYPQPPTEQLKFFRKTPISNKGSPSTEVSEKRIIAKAALPEGCRSNSLVGRHIRKRFFGHGTHLGKITKFLTPYYTILYDDGDTEEMLESEIDEFLTQPKARNSV